MEIALARAPGARRTYELAGVGTLRIEGFFGRAASADAGGGRWRFARRGFWGRVLEAVDESGAPMGAFRARFRGGGTLAWRGRNLEVRPAARWRQRYALADGDRELARLEGKSWGKTPVLIDLAEPDALEPGLLLFAAFVVRGLAADAGGAAAAAGSIAA